MSPTGHRQERRPYAHTVIGLATGPIPATGGNMIKEFKEFITRGNVVDLAVALVVGAAFTGVVTSFANDVLMQIVAAIFGKPDFGTASFDLNGTPIVYGSFLNACINFLIVALAMFLVVKAVNTMQNLRKREELEEAEITEVALLTEIRDALRQQNP
jgi:large conductance mechanosensitive channel